MIGSGSSASHNLNTHATSCAFHFWGEKVPFSTATRSCPTFEASAESLLKENVNLTWKRKGVKVYLKMPSTVEAILGSKLVTKFRS